MIGDLLTAIFVSRRSIGGIIPDVTVEEHHEDELTVTDHPVEQGARITDHAFKNPARLTMRVAWSDSSLLVDSIVSGSLFTGSISSVDDLYNQMLDLQASREPFDVVTGKRAYTDMLITRLSTTTNQDTENSLVLEVGMRQVIIVQTQETATKPDADQANPQDTGSTVNAGTKQPQQSQKQSALSALFGG